MAEGRVSDIADAERTIYTVDGVSYAVRPRYYLASCDGCGWIGSSEDCGQDYGGDDSDVYCPKCHLAGADCGAVAERAHAVEIKSDNSWRGA